MLVSFESRTGLSFRFPRREAQAVRLWAHKPLKDKPVRLSLYSSYSYLFVYPF